MPIAFNHVSIVKNNFTVLEDINISLEGNLLIIGESGSGKSTLLDALASKVFPTKGTITKSGITKVTLVNRDYSFHKIVGGVYQYYQQRFNSHDAAVGPTVYEILQNQILPVGTVDLASVTLREPTYTDDWVNEVCESLHIKHLLNQKITSLSNGETRRTLLAYTLLQKPEVLLLDNPFTGLDVEARQLLKEILSTLKNVFLVCSLADAPKGFNRLIAIKNGKVIFDGQIQDYPINRKTTFILNSDLLAKIQKKQPTVNNDFNTAIKINNGNVSYFGKNVLQGINWEVKRGERWALMGPNGSGKSSLLSLITADNPQCYQNDIVLFDRQRGSGESIWDIKSKMGFVSPELHLYFNKHQLVWRTMASGFFDTAGLFRKITEEQDGLIDDYLELLNISNLKNRPLSQLSFGQQRLVFLARALVKNPPLLILDEPCQGLDYNQMVFFREMLNEIAIKQNKTMVFVTHYKDEIPACVTCCLNLFEGRELL